MSIKDQIKQAAFSLLLQCKTLIANVGDPNCSESTIVSLAKESIEAIDEVDKVCKNYAVKHQNADANLKQQLQVVNKFKNQLKLASVNVIRKTRQVIADRANPLSKKELAASLTDVVTNSKNIFEAANTLYQLEVGTPAGTTFGGPAPPPPPPPSGSQPKPKLASQSGPAPPPPPPVPKGGAERGALLSSISCFNKNKLKKAITKESPNDLAGKVGSSGGRGGGGGKAQNRLVKGDAPALAALAMQQRGNLRKVNK